MRDHPRLRGEQSFTLNDIAHIGGSPPLARGTGIRLLLLVSAVGITPACAGNRDKENGSNFSRGDHPRLRGEQLSSVFQKKYCIGSPPLARGTV